MIEKHRPEGFDQGCAYFAETCAWRKNCRTHVSGISRPCSVYPKFDHVSRTRLECLDDFAETYKDGSGMSASKLDIVLVYSLVKPWVKSS